MIIFDDSRPRSFMFSLNKTGRRNRRDTCRQRKTRRSTTRTYNRSKSIRLLLSSSLLLILFIFFSLFIFFDISSRSHPLVREKQPSGNDEYVYENNVKNYSYVRIYVCIYISVYLYVCLFDDQLGII